jgi:hypothetical protein
MEEGILLEFFFRSFKLKKKTMSGFETLYKEEIQVNGKSNRH